MHFVCGRVLLASPIHFSINKCNVQILGRSKLVEDCITFDRLKGVPPQSVHNYRGSNVFVSNYCCFKVLSCTLLSSWTQVCCPDPIDGQVIFEDPDKKEDDGEIDYSAYVLDDFEGFELDDQDSNTQGSNLKTRCNRDPTTKCSDLSDCNKSGKLSFYQT